METQLKWMNGALSYDLVHNNKNFPLLSVLTKQQKKEATMFHMWCVLNAHNLPGIREYLYSHGIWCEVFIKFKVSVIVVAVVVAGMMRKGVL